MKIQLLYFDGCPSWETGLKNLQTALKDENLSASIELVNVMDEDDARSKRFTVC